MNVLLVLIPVTMVIVIIAVAIFFWAVNHQQFDDLDSPAVLPLMEETEANGLPQNNSEANDKANDEADASR